MASSIEATKVLCSVCNKAKGIYTCGGCSHAFCPKHSNDHRDDLNKQLDEIVTTYDIVHQKLNEQANDPQKNPLMIKINQWEEESIKKIRQAAEKARNDLLESSDVRTTQIKEKMNSLSKELKQGREENDFSEIDLRQWIKELEELKHELQNPKTIILHEGSTSLVTNIYIGQYYKSDIFQRVCDNAQIKESGQLVVKSNSVGHVEIRGKNEYSTGKYALRFRIEHLESNGWIFFGIISKSQSMQTNSFYSPTSYGWSNRNQIYVGISGQVNSDQQTFGINQNDTITLSIDCDQRKIQLKNIRLDRTQELSIDISKCPFPWQLHLNLHAASTQVRILD